MKNILKQLPKQMKNKKPVSLKEFEAAVKQELQAAAVRYQRLHLLNTNRMLKLLIKHYPKK